MARWGIVGLVLAMALICGVVEEGSYSSCDELWMDCPGTANDYLVCSRASDLEGHSSYYDCSLGRRVVISSVPVGCVPEFRY